MYLELVKSLTREQIDELEARGVARSTVSNWKYGKRHPTRPQTLHLAQVTGVPVMDLEAELMLLEAAPEQRDLFRRVLSEAGAAVAVWLLVFGLTYAPKDANATPLKLGIDNQALYIMSTHKALRKLAALLGKLARSLSNWALRRFPIHAESTTKKYAVFSSIA